MPGQSELRRLEAELMRLERLDDKNATIRWEAASTLAAIGPAAKDAVPALEKARKDPSPNVSQTAQFALECIRKK